MPKKPLKIASIIIILFGIFGVISNTIEKNDFLSSKVIVAKIIEKPLNCELLFSKGSIIKVNYNNKIIIKGISKYKCEELVSNQITVKISENKNKIFFLDEMDYIKDQIIFSYIIIAIGILCFIKSN